MPKVSIISIAKKRYERKNFVDRIEQTTSLHFTEKSLGKHSLRKVQQDVLQCSL